MLASRSHSSEVATGGDFGGEKGVELTSSSATMSAGAPEGSGEGGEYAKARAENVLLEAEPSLLGETWPAETSSPESKAGVAASTYCAGPGGTGNSDGSMSLPVVHELHTQSSDTSAAVSGRPFTSPEAHTTYSASASRTVVPPPRCVLAHWASTAALRLN